MTFAYSFSAPTATMPPGGAVGAPEAGEHAVASRPALSRAATAAPVRTGMVRVPYLCGRWCPAARLGEPLDENDNHYCYGPSSRRAPTRAAEHAREAGWRLPTGEDGGMADRLKNATSPYLLQHADNPVDWWPWSPEAFAAARERDVPVMLSVGYSACHWCHVMAHESFEDPQTAALLNDNLVSIKVDREERPDVDAVYMTATQAMTGQGGWPMTVFMTPDGAPFYCGTYFPRDRFQHLVRAVMQAWREDRDGVTGQAGRIAAALAEQAGPWPAGDGADLAGVCDQAVLALARQYDAERGGFGGAPKFPPSMVCEFLLRHSERPDAPGAARALEMATGTMAAMAR